MEDAYEQGLKASNCIVNQNDFKFDLKDKSKYQFNKKIDDVYVVTVVLDGYSGLTHQTHSIARKTKYEEFPVALSIFDLEVMIKYLNTPEKFVDYISSRVKYSKHFLAENEIVVSRILFKKGIKTFR